jgi:hypothetical protein
MHKTFGALDLGDPSEIKVEFHRILEENVFSTWVRAT